MEIFRSVRRDMRDSLQTRCDLRIARILYVCGAKSSNKDNTAFDLLLLPATYRAMSNENLSI